MTQQSLFDAVQEPNEATLEIYEHRENARFTLYHKTESNELVLVDVVESTEEACREVAEVWRGAGVKVTEFVTEALVVPGNCDVIGNPYDNASKILSLLEKAKSFVYFMPTYEYSALCCAISDVKIYMSDIKREEYRARCQ